MGWHWLPGQRDRSQRYWFRRRFFPRPRYTNLGWLLLIFIAGAGLLFRILTIEYALLYPEIRRFLWNLDFSECGFDRTLVSAEDESIVGVEEPERWTAVFLHKLYCYSSPNRFSFSGFPGPDIIKSMELEIPEYLDLEWDTPKMSQSPSMYVAPQGRRIYVLDSIYNPAFFFNRNRHHKSADLQDKGLYR
ncbi:hypothetical protein GF359_03895 [candidate division WOR-3 bacterium]|uniref:Uncharacterized protein n=1 Tax=candidate division WOR-3 bacterium TaxID=2052148 RepID=A0A9D5K9X8_UNCW3|nr:hypothetical protein [candidate division WOR-3 bacterium]MBD3364339.1 hypothetical protein [candidate division WOR-3 bacterium]